MSEIKTPPCQSGQEVDQEGTRQQHLARIDLKLAAFNQKLADLQKDLIGPDRDNAKSGSVPLVADPLRLLT